MKKKIKPKKYNLTDLQDDDISLLSRALQLAPKSFFCYGNRWYKLFSLQLIDEETRVTPHGLEVIKIYQKFVLN